MAISPLGGGFDQVWEGGEGIGAPGHRRWNCIVTKTHRDGTETQEAFRVSAASPQGALGLAQETQNEDGLNYRVTPEAEWPES